MAEFGDWLGEGRLLLETDDLIFRGAARMKVPLRDVTGVTAENGWLVVEHTAGRARFDLGTAAAKWADAIRNPRSLLDKLGVKPTSRVAVLGLDDDAFVDEVRTRTPEVKRFDAADAVEGEFDLVFYRADEPEALDALDRLRRHIPPDGAVWVISPKRRPEIADVVVITAAKRHGLVDVKTARFSDSLTSLKLMIPRAQRR